MSAKIEIEIHSSGIITATCDPACTKEDMEWVQAMMSHIRAFKDPVIHVHPDGEATRKAQHCPVCGGCTCQRCNACTCGDGLCHECGSPSVVAYAPGRAYCADHDPGWDKPRRER